MPEYLAPGVFVEETSFRAKSIEGVSTSTTGFVGPTRRGPIARPAEAGRPMLVPEILTSFLDFQRIYGGFEDLTFDAAAPSLNYLAHAVRAYFDNGGARLFVARVYTRAAAGDGVARSAELMTGVRFVARTPGRAGDGTIEVALRGAPATSRTIANAPRGTMIRVGTRDPARPAQITGGRPPFAVPQDGRLLLRVAGTDRDVTFHGEPAEVVGGAALGASVTLGAANVLTVEVDGRVQALTLPSAATPRADLLDAINRELVGGAARLTTAAEGTANQLAIASDVQGRASRVTVRASGAGAPLGFATDASASGAAIAANNVQDRDAIGVADLAALFAAAGIPAVAGLDGDGMLTIATVATGAAAAISIRTGPGAAHGALGFADTAAGAGSGTPPVAFVRGATGFVNRGGGPLNGDPDAQGVEVVTISVVTRDGDDVEKAYDELGLDPAHPRYLGRALAPEPTRRADQLEQGFAIELPSPAPGAFDLLDALERNPRVTLTGGGDGVVPTAAAYRQALDVLAAIEDVSIVAAPAAASTDQRQAIHDELITHAEARRAYRIAVLDTVRISTPMEARDDRARLDSTRAALYTPWVIVANPLFRPGDERHPREIALPPSGFVCGIYARNDIERGVFKAPANEVVRGALRHDVDINFAQQEVLNPLGINCLRFFPNRGNRVWGARTVSSDPEWRYVNVRRYFHYLERSIDVSTQWAVFEPNGERLWANIRETVASFLVTEWRSGALLGAGPKEAFFVRCDRSTMDQNDLDNGRLVCLIGVAVVKPAEFVIFRVGQKTADARS